jgi:hypothetical protein
LTTGCHADSGWDNGIGGAVKRIGKDLTGKEKHAALKGYSTLDIRDLNCNYLLRWGFHMIGGY